MMNSHSFIFRLLTPVLLSVLLLPLTVHAATYAVSACNEQSLDRALSSAQDGDTIRFECSGVIRLTGVKVISKNITINGSGHTVTLDGHNAVPIFSIDAKATVTIIHLNIANGRATAGAGGITNRGTLTISNSTLSGNWHAVVNFSTLTVISSFFANNSGVGIYNSRNLTIIGSTFTGNDHGLDNGSGTVTVANSTFAGNRVMLPDSFGAGIANSGKLVVLNSTFADNVASGAGGGIGTHKGGAVTLRNTIIANNSPTNCYGLMIDGGHNLQFPGSDCGNSIPKSDPLLRPLGDNGGYAPTMALGSGSPAIGAGNRDTCLKSPVNNVDQRGFLRLAGQDGTCDIGAVESVPLYLMR